MKRFKRISNQILGISALLVSGNVLATIDWDRTQILGETATFDHLNLPEFDDSEFYSDRIVFTLDSVSPVNISVVDGRLARDSLEDVAYHLNISDFVVKDSGSNTLCSTGVSGGLTDPAYTIEGLVDGSYELVFDGLADVAWGEVYNVTVSTVPLPAAAWLFGTALAGFVVYSARRSV